LGLAPGGLVVTRQPQLSTLRVPIGSLAAKILGEQGLWQLLTDLFLRSRDR